jgi:hypothetical protein
MPFQSKINIAQAPGVNGDFASTNPFSSVLTAQGGLVAPVGGLTVGNFFWVGPAGQTSQSYVSGWQIAFLGRNEQALIVQFLGEYTMLVPEGFMVTGFTGGDFWAYFANGATAGATVYADETTGAPQMQATNSFTGAVGMSATSALATVVALSNVLTVTAVTAAEVISIGDTLAGTLPAADLPANTTIVAQLTGTTGGIGTYQMSAAATTTQATPTAFSTTSSVLYISAIADGGLSVGDVVSGSGITSGSSIGSFGTGTGGTGTYNLIIPGGVPFTAASTTVSGPSNISSGWTVGPITLSGAGIAKINHAVV